MISQPNHSQSLEDQCNLEINNQPTPDPNHVHTPTQHAIPLPTFTHHSATDSIQEPSSPQDLITPQLLPVDWGVEMEEHNPSQRLELASAFSSPQIQQNGHVPMVSQWSPDTTFAQNELLSDQNRHRFGEPGPAPSSPSELTQSFRDASPQSPFPTQTTNLDVPNSTLPHDGNTASMADLWIKSIEDDLSNIPALRNMPNDSNRDSDRATSSMADSWIKSIEEDLFNIPALQNIPNELNIEFNQEQRNISGAGAYTPPNDIYQDLGGNTGGADVFGDSSFSGPLQQFHHAQVQHNLTTPEPINDTRHGSDSGNSNARDNTNRSTTPFNRHTNQPLTNQPLPSAPHGENLRQEQNPYVQDHVPGVELSTNNPEYSPAPELLQRPEEIATHKTRYKSSKQSRGSAPCPECPEIFQNSANALRHLKNCHFKKNLYPCEYCDASFEGSGARTNHMKKAHSNVMPQVPVIEPIIRTVNGKPRFYCSFEGCSKHYSSPNSVQRHFEMHHANIRYPCECGHEATTKSNLKAHRTNCNLHQPE